jgi:hypothetical protein
VPKPRIKVEMIKNSNGIFELIKNNFNFAEGSGSV